MSLSHAIIATVIVSLISLVGVITISLSDKLLDKILLWLVALASGAMLGGAFLHLLPEAFMELGEVVGLYAIIGFVIFFFVERVLHWHHCHEGQCDVHTFTYMTLIGDTIHNFIDGILIASSFMVDYSLGVATTLAVIAHEIPQEIGDFAVLVHGGFSKSKAMFYNFLSATVAILGALVGYFISSSIEGSVLILVSVTAGGFIYVAASDLIPELHKEADNKKAWISFLFFIIGVALMYGIKLVFES